VYTVSDNLGRSVGESHIPIALKLLRLYATSLVSTKVPGRHPDGSERDVRHQEHVQVSKCERTQMFRHQPVHWSKVKLCKTPLSQNSRSIFLLVIMALSIIFYYQKFLSRPWLESGRGRGKYVVSD
jgi:hypothetical protein